MPTKKKKDLAYWLHEARKAVVSGGLGASALIAGGFIDGPAAKVVAGALAFLAATGITHQVKNTESN